MNNKGFTLTELVGSIILLAVIALIALPALMGMLDAGQKNVDDSVKSVLESAAAEYVNDHIDEADSLSSVSVCTLVENDYVSYTFYEKNKESVEKGIIEVATNDDGTKYTFEYNDDGNTDGCFSDNE